MKLHRRRAVSELLATLMMMGVTLSAGGYVAAAALNQFNLAQNSESLAVAVQEAAAGKLVSLIYTSVTPSQACPIYGGFHEGMVLTLALYDYGTTSYSPAEVFVNGTLYSGGGYGVVPSDSEATFTLTLSSCVHPSGQTIFLVDSYGDEVQIAT